MTRDASGRICGPCRACQAENAQLRSQLAAVEAERDERRGEIERLLASEREVIADLEAERDALKAALGRAKVDLDDIDDLGRDVLIWKDSDLGNQIREACAKATAAIDAALARQPKEDTDGK